MAANASSPVSVPCQGCRVKLDADSRDLLLELTCDGKPLVYSSECWEREFGAES